MRQEQQNTGYFQRRAEEERAAAERCGDERAAQSHRELAARYRDLAANGAPQPGSDGEDKPPQKPGILAPDFTILP